jgi:hypothetical protein
MEKLIEQDEIITKSLFLPGQPHQIEHHIPSTARQGLAVLDKEDLTAMDAELVLPPRLLPFEHRAQ